MTRPVTFFITTARSGTQWLTTALRQTYGDAVVARHEPVGYAYRPKSTLRDPDALRALAREPEIAAHFASVREIAAERPYVEVGFPAYALAPVLREQFGDALRLVQLTRHPVLVATSITTQGWFRRGRRVDAASRVAPEPTDPGVLLPEYAARWDGLTEFEKGLYYWYQVHAYGREVAASAPAGQFARFAFEDLLEDRDACAALAAHLGLGPGVVWQDGLQSRVVDRFHHKTAVPIEPWRAAAHPEVVELAAEFGYAVDAVDPRALDERYRKSWPLRAWAALGKVIRR